MTFLITSYTWIFQRTVGRLVWLSDDSCRYFFHKLFFPPTHDTDLREHDKSLSESASLDAAVHAVFQMITVHHNTEAAWHVIITADLNVLAEPEENRFILLQRQRIDYWFSPQIMKQWLMVPGTWYLVRYHYEVSYLQQQLKGGG